jgi:hypothetical protein
MALYTLSPKYKKSAIEVASWTKDGVTISRSEGYRGGTFYCESDTQPDISLADNDELDVGCADCGTADCWEMEELWDGCWADWEFPDDMPEEERERIEALWEENYYEGMEEDGWYNSDTEYVFQGPLTMTCDGVEIEDDTEENLDIDLDGGSSAVNEQVVIGPTAAWPFPTTKPAEGKAEWPFPSVDFKK